MKFLISTGHTPTGTAGCGAVGYLDESKCTRQISPLVVQKLEQLGHTAILLQTDYGTTRDFVERTNQANNYGGDLFVEIHLNAGGGSGAEVWTTPNSSATSYAVKVSSCISKAIGIANRGHKTTTGLYVLKHTSMPAILIECCFVDNEKDYKAYNADKIAEAIVKGITGQVVKSQSKGQWIKTDNGRWWYKHSDGSYTKKDFELIDGNWYYFDYEGYMITGWLHLTSNNQDYYFFSNGTMASNCKLWGTWEFDADGHGKKIE